MRIENIEELKEYIENNEVSSEEIKTLLRQTLNIWYSGTMEKKRLMKFILKFVQMHPVLEIRPLLIDDEYLLRHMLKSNSGL